MGRGGSDDTTTVEVDEASVLAAGEDDAPVEGVAALRADEAETPLEIERITLSGEMTSQVPTGRIADLQFLDESRVVHAAPFKIPQCLRVARELPLIESRSLLQHCGRVGQSALLLEVSKALAKGEALRQLDQANEITALAAAVAVEEIFTGVDVERRSGFRVQGTESDELGAVTRRPGGPMVLP
jgi:hypothetical protein